MNKLDMVSGSIFADIASGGIPPGGKLPTFYDLEKSHGVSRRTINASIKLLKANGLVTTKERGGVFVSEKPAMLKKFAMVFPKSDLKNRFIQTLFNVLREEGAKRKIEFEIFTDFEPHTDNSDYQKLLSELERMRIGGVAHFAMPTLSENCALLHFPGIPVINATSCIKADFKAYADKSCDYLLSRKKKRIAVLFQGDRLMGSFLEKRDNSEMSSPDHWFVPIGNDARQGTGSITRILLDCPREKRPNGLIITDDNLVDHALSGVFSSRVKVPAELEIVTHCNWPNPAASAIPVKRLGYDVREVVSMTIDSLLKSRGKGGLQHPEPIPLVPLFEEELK
jgi:DNA-binding transcriptional regulator YhcF (GntR family)